MKCKDEVIARMEDEQGVARRVGVACLLVAGYRG